jgi:hypothetical protein
MTTLIRFFICRFVLSEQASGEENEKKKVKRALHKTGFAKYSASRSK